MHTHFLKHTIHTTLTTKPVHLHSSHHSLLVCGLALLTLFSCGDKQKGSTTQVPEIAFHPDTDKKMTDLFNDFTFIQLEGNDDCLVPEVRRVFDINDTLVVLSSTNEVFTFDRNTGHYIGRISTQGEGPEEYVEASELIATPEHHIGIVDRMKGDIKFFNTMGQYLTTKKIGGEVAWMNSAELTPDGKLLVSNQLTGGNPPQKYAYTLAEIGQEGKGQQFDAFAPIKVGQFSTPFAEKPATVCGKDMSLLKFLNDTLFCYHDGKVEPKCRLATPLPLPSHEVVAQQGDYDIKALAKLCQNGNFFMGFDRIFETEGMMLLVTNVPEQNGFYWVDKKTQKGYIWTGTAELKKILRGVVTGRCIYNPVASSDTELFQGIYPDFDVTLMKEVLDQEQGKTKPFDKRLRAFLDKVDTEGNACLFIYRHKK